MAIDLKKLVRTSDDRSNPVIMIHGVSGYGKTSLASEFPAPVYLHVTGEKPPAGIDMPAFDVLTSYNDLTSALGELASGEHEFETVIIDSTDGIEPFIWRETCARNKWSNLEEPGYGKGYLAADEVWQELIFGLNILRNERRMNIVLIAHSEIKQFEEPGKPAYSRYDLKTHKRATALLTQSADYILFVGLKTEIKEVETGFNKKNTHAEGGGMRWIFTDARPAFVAKNRSATMPAQIIYKKGEGYKVLAPHIFPALAAVKAVKSA